MSRSLERTNPNCTGSDHGRLVSATRGCTCPETSTALKERQRAKNASKANHNRTITPAVNETEPDFVAVMRFMDGHIGWKQLQYEADRAAVVVQLARDLPVSTIASRLGASKQRIANLLAQGQRVAA